MSENNISSNSNNEMSKLKTVDYLNNFYVHIHNSHGFGCDMCKVNNVTDEQIKKYYLDLQSSYFMFLLPCFHTCCFKCLKNVRTNKYCCLCPVCNEKYDLSNMQKLYPYV